MYPFCLHIGFRQTGSLGGTCTCHHGPSKGIQVDQCMGNEFLKSARLREELLISSIGCQSPRLSSYLGIIVFVVQAYTTSFYLGVCCSSVGRVVASNTRSKFYLLSTVLDLYSKEDIIEKRPEMAHMKKFSV